MNLRLRCLALVAIIPSIAAAQQIGQLPRITPTTGLADSALFMCTDSTKAVTRACKFSLVQQRLAFKPWDSLVVTNKIRLPGTLNLTGGSITGSPTATFGAITVSGCTGCAPAVVDSATGAARAQILTTARTIGGTSFNGSANIVPGLADSATGAVRAQTLTTARTIGGVSFNGSANIIPDTATGVVRAQTLTTARALWGQSFNGSAAITGSLTSVGDISGGASSMNLLAGTGASRRLVLQTTTSGSTATTALRFNELQQSLHADGTATNPSIAFASDTLSGMYNTGSSVLRFGTAGTLRMQISSSVSSGVFASGIPFKTSYAGAVSTPSLSFNGNGNLGFYLPGPDTLALAIESTQILSFAGTAGASLIGGAGNMTVQCGTGNSRTCTFQSTTSAGTVKNTLVLGADTTVTTIGTLVTPDSLRFTNAAVIRGGAGSMVIRSGTGATRNLTVNVTDGTSTEQTAAIFKAASIDVRPRLELFDTTLFASSGTATGTAVLRGGAGSMTIQAGTGASRFLTFKNTNSISSSFSALVLSAAGQTQTARNTNAVTPDYTFIGDTASGFYQPATNQAGIATTGVASMIITGGATPTWTGGAGSLTLVSGSGNSRRFVAQTTTSGGTATTFLRANELQQTLHADGAVGTPGIGFAADSLLGFYRLGTAGASDTIAVSANGVVQMKIAPSGILRLPALPAEGSTKNAMCWDGTTFNVTQNAAATCTVSSARFKENIVPIDAAAAWKIVGKPQLHSSTYNERIGGRKAIGIIAEQADSADKRLASRDANGLITSTNYEEVTSLLLTIVKNQQRQIDSLIAAGKKKP